MSWRLMVAVEAWREAGENGAITANLRAASAHWRYASWRRRDGVEVT